MLTLAYLSQIRTLVERLHTFAKKERSKSKTNSNCKRSLALLDKRMEAGQIPLGYYICKENHNFQNLQIENSTKCKDAKTLVSSGTIKGTFLRLKSVSLKNLSRFMRRKR